MVDNFVFTISYYQKGLFEKKIIIVNLNYASTYTLTSNQNDGIDPSPYNLTFNFIPLSHTELLIEFAF
jgi:hypothetical protein